jgi:hypothetical protein
MNTEQPTLREQSFTAGLKSLDPTLTASFNVAVI